MIRRVCVVIPAADEERRIGGCLTSVLAAARAIPAHLGRSVVVDVITVLDGCRDGTARVIASFPEVIVSVVDARSVGIARSSGTEVAMRRVDGSADPSAVLLANTDADSSVPRDWLAHLISRADAGADLVLGTVRPSAGLTPEVRRRWRNLHRLHDGHPHVHGANLAVRASTLAAVGGWEAMRSGEDVDLVNRVDRLGAEICRTGGAAVHTSARPIGRAPQGFSSYLRALGRPRELPAGGIGEEHILSEEVEQRAVERVGLVEVREVTGSRQQLDPAARKLATRGLQV